MGYVWGRVRWKIGKRADTYSIKVGISLVVAENFKPAVSGCRHLPDVSPLPWRSVIRYGEIPTLL